MKPRILLIYTGGTIGMMANPNTGELQPLDFVYMHQQIPEIARLALEVIPISIAQPIDSSHMNPSHWVELVELIEHHEPHVDGFVILHGTDTMAYTASAISFMIQGLSKPIVFTGSQLPVGILRSDGKENILAALEIAGKKRADGDAALQEVAVFFQSKLFRGSRVSKISAHQFDAFDSPNYPLLGVAGVDIKIHTNQLLEQHAAGVTYSKILDQRVGLVKLYPGINLEAYGSVFDPVVHRAVVIEAFGSGNTPNHEAFAKVLSETLLNQVSEYYIEILTKKSRQNLSILQAESDSIKQVMNQNLSSNAMESDLNVNPLKQSLRVNQNRKMIDLQVSVALYGEIVKNLKLAEISLRKQTPLIQVIDSPTMPLDESGYEWWEWMVIGMLMGFILFGFFIYRKDAGSAAL